MTLSRLPAWGVTTALVVPPLLGLVAAAWQAPVDPYAVGSGVRWDRAFAAAGSSLWLALVVVVASGALGTFLGWGQARWSGKAVAFASIAASLPLVVPSYVTAAALSRFWADLTGAPPSGMAAAVVVLVLATVPLVQLTVATGLRATSAAEEEAAASLGASDAAIVRAVVWPRLRPALALSSLLVGLYAISDFGVVAMLDVPVLTWRMYDAVARQQLLRAAVLGGLAFAAVLPLAALAWIVRGQAPAQGVANQRPRPAGPAGGLLTSVYVALACGVGIAGALLPIGVLGSWVAEGVGRGLLFADPVPPLLHTLAIAGGGATALVGISAIPAFTRGGRALEGAVYATSVLPAILVAFGWLGAALGVARLFGGRELYTFLMSSGTLLVLAYTARFLAEVHGPLKTSFLRLDPRHQDAVAVLGAPPSAWLRWVALPAVRPGASTAFLLGVVVLAKELPITLLLGTPAGLQPLAFRLWDRYGEALWHDAGVAGLLLIGVGAVGRVALWWQGATRLT